MKFEKQGTLCKPKISLIIIEKRARTKNGHMQTFMTFLVEPVVIKKNLGFFCASCVVRFIYNGILIYVGDKDI